MKNYKFIVIILSLLFVCAVSPAQAQKGPRLTVEIPFEFSVGDKRFEPGKYSIAGLNANDGSAAVLHFYSRAGKSQTIVTTRPVFKGYKNDGTGPSLVFNRYGNEYFLAGVSNPAENFAVEIRKSKIEIRIAKGSGAPVRQIVPSRSE